MGRCLCPSLPIASALFLLLFATLCVFAAVAQFGNQLTPPDVAVFLLPTFFCIVCFAVKWFVSCWKAERILEKEPRYVSSDLTRFSYELFFSISRGAKLDGTATCQDRSEVPTIHIEKCDSESAQSTPEESRRVIFSLPSSSSLNVPDDV